MRFTKSKVTMLIAIVVLVAVIAGLAIYIQKYKEKVANKVDVINTTEMCRKLVDFEIVTSQQCKQGYDLITPSGPNNIGKAICVKYAPVGQDIPHIIDISGDALQYSLNSNEVIPKCVASSGTMKLTPGLEIQHIDEDGTITYKFGACLAMGKASDLTHYKDIKATPISELVSISGSIPAVNYINPLKPICSKAFGEKYDPLALLWDNTSIKIGVSADGVSMRKDATNIGLAIKKAGQKRPNTPITVVCGLKSSTPCSSEGGK